MWIQEGLQLISKKWEQQVCHTEKNGKWWMKRYSSVSSSFVVHQHVLAIVWEFYYLALVNNALWLRVITTFWSNSVMLVCLGWSINPFYQLQGFSTCCKYHNVRVLTSCQKKNTLQSKSDLDFLQWKAFFETHCGIKKRGTIKWMFILWWLVHCRLNDTREWMKLQWLTQSIGCQKECRFYGQWSLIQEM